MRPARSVSAQPDYPGMGPKHAHVEDTGRAGDVTVTDVEALTAFRVLAQVESVVSARAVAWVPRGAVGRNEDDLVIISTNGPGDRDVAHVTALTGAVV